MKMKAEKKRHRFYVQAPLGLGPVAVHDPDLASQLSRVLKIATGEEIILFHGDGNEYVVRFSQTEKGIASGEAFSKAETPDAALPEVTVAVALIRKERFEWMLEKLTELGVRRIVPLETARTIRFPWKPERFSKIIKEAAEQSGRGIVPELTEPRTLKAELAEKVTKTIVCQRGAAPSKKSHSGPVRLLIGPEGGWSTEELAMFEQLKFETLSLGALTLRTETAALVGAAGFLGSAITA